MRSSPGSPQVHPKREPLEERLQRYERYYNVSTEQLGVMYREFLDELHRGLKAFGTHPYLWVPEDCSFKMLDSCVYTLPTGDETGVFYALDFGGTNFRAVRAKLLGKGIIKVSDEKRVISDAVDEHNPIAIPLTSKHASASDLFNFFSKTVKTLMEREGNVLSPSSYGRSTGTTAAGFTFSYPCSQRKLNSAHLIEWTKGFATGRGTVDPVEGSDVAELMNFAFSRNEVPVHVSAVINDTVGTLLSACYTTDKKQNPPCLVGIILGTGVNACYVERYASEYGYQGKVINIECGNFNRSLPQINVDHEVDFASGNRGKQKLEKMVSGAYLGEICRRTLIKVLQHTAPANAWIPFSMSSESASAIMEDLSDNHKAARKAIWDAWEVPENEISDELLDVIKKICLLVFRRSAALAAVIIAATAKQTGHLQQAMGGVTVCIDGSLYKHLKSYRTHVDEYLNTILGDPIAKLVNIQLSDDGSGKGAAVLAATLSSHGESK